MTIIKSLTVITTVLLLLIADCASLKASPQIGPQVGKIAPDFILTDLSGEKISLSAFRGQPVLLKFWASWCGTCRREKPLLQAIFAEKVEAEKIEVAILTINIKESQKTVSDFMKRNNYTFPVLLDSYGKVSQSYQVRAIPITFLIDKNSIIKAVKVGAFRNKAEIENFLKDWAIE